MSSSAVLGQFLWHELLTADPEAGAGFYSKVFGWSAQPWEGTEEYTMLTQAQGPVGGARVIGKDPLADEAGPSWLTYVGVPDIEAALAEVESKGGQTIHPVTPVGTGGGRYAVIADPHGATIGLYEPGEGMTGNGTEPAAAPVVWHELTAEDPQAALQFYKDIFGWEVLGTHEMGGEVGTYYLFGLGQTQMGGAFLRSEDQPGSRPRWLVYLGVPSVTAAIEATKAAGGKVLAGPHQVPGGDWTAYMVDSHGVSLAVHGPKDVAATKPKPVPKPKPAAKAAKAEAPAAAKSLTVKSKAKSSAPKAKAPEPAAPKAKTKVVAPKVRSKSKAEVKAKVATKTKTKAKTKAKTKSTPATKSKVKVRVKAKAKSKSSSKPTPKTKTKTKTKTKSKSKAKTKTAPAPKRKSATKSKGRKAPRRGK